MAEERPMKILVKFQCHVDGDTNKPMVSYSAMVHFATHDEMLQAAGESVKRRLQAPGRKNIFPKDRVVDVDAKGRFTKSPDEQAVEITANMTPAQKLAFFQAKMLEAQRDLETDAEEEIVDYDDGAE